METEEELHRKALEWVANLLSRYENGLLSVEALRTGIETVWGCLGGVVTLEAFQELMAEANAHLRDLPESTLVRVFCDDAAGGLMTVMRTGEQVRIHTSGGMKGNFKQFGIETEAAAYVAKIAGVASAKGMREVPA